MQAVVDQSSVLVHPLRADLALAVDPSKLIVWLRDVCRCQVVVDQGSAGEAAVSQPEPEKVSLVVRKERLKRNIQIVNNNTSRGLWPGAEASQMALCIGHRKHANVDEPKEDL